MAVPIAVEVAAVSVAVPAPISTTVTELEADGTPLVWMATMPGLEEVQVQGVSPASDWPRAPCALATNVCVEPVMLGLSALDASLTRMPATGSTVTDVRSRTVPLFASATNQGVPKRRATKTFWSREKKSLDTA